MWLTNTNGGMLYSYPQKEGFVYDRPEESVVYSPGHIRLRPPYG